MRAPIIISAQIFKMGITKVTSEPWTYHLKDGPQTRGFTQLSHSTCKQRFTEVYIDEGWVSDVGTDYRFLLCCSVCRRSNCSVFQ